MRDWAVANDEWRDSFSLRLAVPLGFLANTTGFNFEDLYTAIRHCV
jgi:hypothetical protein